jgi:hypothetical protein
MGKEKLNLESAIRDSRGLPQLVSPDVLIRLSENGRKSKPIIKDKQNQKDTLKWGFFSAVGAYIEGKLNSPQEQIQPSSEKSGHESLDKK